MLKASVQNPEYTTSIQSDNNGNWWVWLIGPDGEEIVDSHLITPDKRTAIKAWMRY